MHSRAALPGRVDVRECLQLVTRSTSHMCRKGRRPSLERKRKSRAENREWVLVFDARLDDIVCISSWVNVCRQWATTSLLYNLKPCPPLSYKPSHQFTGTRLRIPTQIYKQCIYSANYSIWTLWCVSQEPDYCCCTLLKIRVPLQYNITKTFGSNFETTQYKDFPGSNIISGDEYSPIIPIWRNLVTGSW